MLDHPLAALTRPIVLARFALALRRSGGDVLKAAAITRETYGSDDKSALMLRAAAEAGSTDPSSWGAALAPTSGAASAQLIELARPRSAFEQMFPFMRRVDFGAAISAERVGPTVSWVGEAAPKPVSEMAFETLDPLRPEKLTGTVVETSEVQRGSPTAENSMSRSLRDALATMQDTAFFSTTAAVAGVNPAGIFAGISAMTSSGDPGEDAGMLLADFRGDPARAVWVTSPALGAQMFFRGAMFVDVGARGGTLAGIPLVVTSGIAGDTSGGSFALVDASKIAVAAGDVSIDASTQAAMQMNTAPDDPASASTVLVSLWQHNMIALRVERFLNWQRTDDGAVSLVTGASYIGT